MIAGMSQTFGWTGLISHRARASRQTPIASAARAWDNPSSRRLSRTWSPTVSSGMGAGASRTSDSATGPNGKKGTYPTPSGADIDMTRQVVEAGRGLKISVHDHLIVGREGVASFKALGLF